MEQAGVLRLETDGSGAPEAEDAELMQQLARGSMSALGVLVERHQDQVRRVAYRFSGRWDVADDIAQNAFVKLLDNAGRYRPLASLSTWLYRVVVNACLDHAKRRRPVALADVEPPTTPGSLEQICCDELRLAVQRAVAGLPERQRVVILLHRYEGLSHGQISEATGWSTSAVETLLVRAYRELRTRLQEWSEAGA